MCEASLFFSFFFFLQFMGQDLTADFTVSSEPKFGDPLPSFRIYAEHYLICWRIGRKGWGGVGGMFVLPVAAQDWSLSAVADCVGRCCFMRRAHFLSPACTIHQWHKATGAVMPEESEKGCLWNHFPLYLAHNWTALISCQNKYGGCISAVIKNVVWKEQEKALNKGRSSVWENMRETCVRSVRPGSACKGVNLQVGLKKRKKESCLSNCHFGGGGLGRAGGIMGVV